MAVVVQASTLWSASNRVQQVYLLTVYTPSINASLAAHALNKNITILQYPITKNTPTMPLSATASAEPRTNPHVPPRHPCRFSFGTCATSSAWPIEVSHHLQAHRAAFGGSNFTLQPVFPKRRIGCGQVHVRRMSALRRTRPSTLFPPLRRHRNEPQDQGHQPKMLQPQISYVFSSCDGDRRLAKTSRGCVVSLSSDTRLGRFVSGLCWAGSTRSHERAEPHLQLSYVWCKGIRITAACMVLVLLLLLLVLLLTPTEPIHPSDFRNSLAPDKTFCPRHAPNTVHVPLSLHPCHAMARAYKSTHPP